MPITKFRITTVQHEIVYLAWVGGSCVVGRASWVVRRGSCVVGRGSWVVRRGSCVSISQKNLKPNYTMNCQNFARIFLAMPHLY
jgi:hypothetical protein